MAPKTGPKKCSKHGCDKGTLTVLEKGRSKKRKAEEKENADPRKGAKVAKYWVFQRFEVSRVEKVEPEVAQSPFQNQHCQKKVLDMFLKFRMGGARDLAPFQKLDPLFGGKVRVFNYNRPLHQKILQYITPHCNSNCSTPSLQSTAQNTPTLQLHSSTVKIRPSGTSLLYITKTIPRYMTPHYTTTFYATALQLLHYKHSRKHFHSLHQTTLHKSGFSTTTAHYTKKYSNTSHLTAIPTAAHLRYNQRHKTHLHFNCTQVQ